MIRKIKLEENNIMYIKLSSRFISIYLNYYANKTSNERNIEVLRKYFFAQPNYHVTSLNIN